jgi:hypothetical protein
MASGCPRCGDSPAIGVLCKSCASAVPTAESLIPDHVASRLARKDAAAWLIDGFGVPHAVSGSRTLVGRRPQADLVILNGSVSRDHAEIHRVDGGWQVRDLGSRNATHLDGQKVHGRAPLPERAVLRFGDVAFLFVGRPVPLPEPEQKPIETAHAAGQATFRYTMRGPSVDLCLIGSSTQSGEDAGGALLYREAGGPSWAEMSLPPLEFQLLRALCVRAIEEAGSPSRSRGCVPTKQLSRDLPFQSKYANEENVRQVVRRIRSTLAKIGAEGLVEALPGRGYYATWPVLDG